MAFGSVVDYNDNVRGVWGHRCICVLWFGVGCQADSAIIAGAETWVGLGNEATSPAVDHNGVVASPHL